MNKPILVLIATLSVTTVSPADEGTRVRYRDPSGRMSLTVSQEIEVRREEPIEASRDFEFDLALAADSAAEAVTVTIDRARASYVAHGMKQRLGTRDHQVVDAHGDEVYPDRIVDAEVHGEFELGADTVGARHQHRLSVTLRYFAQGAKATQSRHDFRAPGVFGDMLDSLDQGIAGIDIYAGVFVAEGCFAGVLLSHLLGSG